MSGQSAPRGDLPDRLSPVRIEIDAGAPGEPIKGHVEAGRGACTEFSGWIDLVATVEAARIGGSSSAARWAARAGDAAGERHDGQHAKQEAAS